MNNRIAKLLFLLFTFTSILTAAAQSESVALWNGNHRLTGWNQSIFYQKLNHELNAGDRLVFSIADVSGGQIQIAANDNNTDTEKNKFTYVPNNQGQGDYDELGGSEWSYTLDSRMASLLSNGSHYLLVDGHDFTLTAISVITSGASTPDPDPVNPGDITFKQGRHFFTSGDLPLSFSPAHTFTSDWSNKIVLHPEIFPTFDLENYTYTLRVNGSGSIQAGNAKWNADGEEIASTFITIGNFSDSFEINLNKTQVNRLKSGYCMQFNSGEGSVSGIELVVTEGGYVEPDYSKDGFHTDGTRLLDANGNEFVMRGINYSWGWNQDKYWQIKSSKEWGFNTIRIQVGSGKRGFCQKPSADDLRGLIEECERHKLVAVINVQDITDDSEISDLMYAVNFWCQSDIVEVVNAHLATVIVNINNEWPAITDQERWRDGYVLAVPMLREAGIKNTLMIDCGGWGQDAACLPKYGAEVAAADELHNIMFSMHMYQTSGREQDVIRHMSEGLSAGCPLIFGEISFEHKAHLAYPEGGPVAWKDILEYSYRHNLGWIGWSWSGNGGGAETCDMFDGNDWQPLENGKCLIYGPWGSKMTSTQCTVYDVNPEKDQPYRYPAPETYADETFSPFPYLGRDNTDLDRSRNDAPEGSDISKLLPFAMEKWHNSEIYIRPEFFGVLGLDSYLEIELSGTTDGSQIQCYYPTPGNPDRWTVVSEDFSTLSDGKIRLPLYPGQTRMAAPAEDNRPLSYKLGENGLYIKGRQVTVNNISIDRGDLTGVDDIAVDNAGSAPAEIYTISGLRVAEPAPGQIYIVRRGNRIYKIKM